MLLELRIRNMALIDSLELDFSGSGLIVLTGETGAGKSIIMQALHLLSGGRGAVSWIRDDRDQAVVEALFSHRESQAELRSLFDEHGLDAAGETIIRRVIRQNGRSRFYVNDRLVTAGLVGDLTGNLINIASQHDHQQLLVAGRHLDILDTFGELADLRDAFGALYRRWQEAANRLADLKRTEQDKERQRDFLNHQLREIHDAAVVPGEDLALAEERDLLKSSAALVELAGQSLHVMQSGMLENLSLVRRNIEQAASMDKGLKELAERIVSTCYEVEDLELALRDYLGSIPRDRHRLEEINERLALLKQLMRKYGPTLENVIEFGEQARQELEALDDVEHEIELLEKDVAALEKELLAAATGLSDKRRRAADRLSMSMQAELASLSFPGAVFEVPVRTAAGDDLAGISARGADQVEFLFSANPGVEPKPLATIASGGELSRLMLAMKCLLARRDQVDTVVFDEVDAGIGGKAAEAVAAKIVELAGHHQVFCITHLAQIAARADEHFMVSKEVVDGGTVSTITRLTDEQRVMELARMLGGENLTSQTIAFARELLEGGAAREAL